MTNGQNLAKAKHLEDVAQGAKRYILAEILDVTQAVATELENIGGGGTSEVMTGATNVAGKSGLVPAPQVGDNEKFLRGDGTWATVSSSNSSSGVDYVIGSDVSTVEGGVWRDVIDATPVLKLRHGDYEYNFNYDAMTFLGGESVAIATVTPDTYILGTASVSSEGGLWYELSDNVPTLNLHAGNFKYGFNYDTITYKGDKTYLVSYLPFDISTTADACGNVWAASNSDVSLDTDIKKFGTASVYFKYNHMTTTMPFSLNDDAWTVEMWAHTDNVGSFGLCLLGGNITLHRHRIAITSMGNDKDVSTQANVWYHHALVKNGNELLWFRDGVKVDSFTLSSELSDDGLLKLGNAEGSSRIDSFRAWTRALWTSDFMPPTAEDYD